MKPNPYYLKIARAFGLSDETALATVAWEWERRIAALAQAGNSESLGEAVSLLKRLRANADALAVAHADPRAVNSRGIAEEIVEQIVAFLQSGELPAPIADAPRTPKPTTIAYDVRIVAYDRQGDAFTPRESFRRAGRMYSREWERVNASELSPEQAHEILNTPGFEVKEIAAPVLPAEEPKGRARRTEAA